MPDHPTPLNDDDLAKVVGGAGGAPSLKKEDDMAADVYATMKLFQNLAQEMRSSAREVRSAEMSSQVDALKGAANEIRAAAEDRFHAGIVAGTMSIAGGLAQSGAMSIGAAHMAGAKGAMSEASHDLALVKGQISPSFTSVDAMHTLAAGGGIGTIVTATQEKMAAEHDAKRADMEASSQTGGLQQQNANEMMKAMQDVIRDVRDKLSSIEQSRLETTRGISKNI